MGREREADRAVDRRDFLDDADVVHVGEAGAAVGFRKNRSEEPELAQLPENFPGKALGLVPLHDVGTDLRVGEIPGGLSDRLLFGRQNGAHAGNSSA